MVPWEFINLMDREFNSGACVTKCKDYTVQEHTQLNSALRVKENKTTARARSRSSAAREGRVPFAVSVYPELRAQHRVHGGAVCIQGTRVTPINLRGIM